MRKSVFLGHIHEVVQQRGGTLRQWLIKTRELGYEGLECDYVDLAKDPEGFAQLLKDVDLEIASVPYFFEFHKGVFPERIREVVTNIARAGGRKLLAIPGEFCNEQPNALEMMVEGMELVCAEADKVGVTVSLEDFGDLKSPCRDAAGIKYFFDRIPTLKFNMDTGNFLCMDADLLESAGLLIDRIAHVHLKDWSYTQMQARNDAFVTPAGVVLYPCPVGSGAIPMTKALAMAEAAGYNGFCSAEHYGVADQWDFVVKSAAWMNQNL